MPNKSKIRQLHAGQAPVVVHSKCRPPEPLSAAIWRSRLDHKLTEIRNTRVTLLRAIAGTGKTELMSQWSQTLQGQGKTIAWLTLGNGDNNPARVLATVLTS